MPTKSLFEQAKGPNFIHPNPPTPENTLLGVGGCIKAYKIRAAWGLKIYTPTPLHWKMLLARNGGRGGGDVYNFALDKRPPKLEPGSVRPNEVLENPASRVCPEKNRELLKEAVFEKRVFEQMTPLK